MNNKVKKIEASPKSVCIEIAGLEVTLSFTEKEDTGVRACIFDILTRAYEKRCLEEVPPEQKVKFE